MNFINLWILFDFFLNIWHIFWKIKFFVLIFHILYPTRHLSFLWFINIFTVVWIVLWEFNYRGRNFKSLSVNKIYLTLIIQLYMIKKIIFIFHNIFVVHILNRIIKLVILYLRIWIIIVIIILAAIITLARLLSAKFKMKWWFWSLSVQLRIAIYFLIFFFIAKVIKMFHEQISPALWYFIHDIFLVFFV